MEPGFLTVLIIAVLLLIAGIIALVAYSRKLQHFKATGKFPGGQPMTTGFAIGIPIGIAIGVILMNVMDKGVYLSIGIAIGVAAGVIIGAALEGVWRK
ncbi:MAG: hypothetical protein ABIE22_03050 [archaeon]